VPFPSSMITHAILAYLDDDSPGSPCPVRIAAERGHGVGDRLTADYGPLMEAARQGLETFPPVLVVDDEPGMLRSISRILKRRGYRTIAAADGRAAVELCLQYRPRLVFLDLSMPHCNGAQVLKELRQRLGDASPSVVIVTGSVSSQQLVSLGGAVAVVNKPFRNEQIVELAEQHAPAR
jgi:CheY-like chemotaxis protein